MNPPIVVVGPHRSGTTIASRIIAHDFDLNHVDESQFILGTDYTNCVIQLPGLLGNHVLFKHAYPRAQYVYMIRNKQDVIESMHRIQWCRDDVFDWESFVSEWYDHCALQWHLIKHDIPEQCSEIYYDSLQDHPLFVAKERRSDFTSKQWKEGEPVGPRHWRQNLKGIQELHECIRRT